MGVAVLTEAFHNLFYCSSPEEGCYGRKRLIPHLSTFSSDSLSVLCMYPGTRFSIKIKYLNFSKCQTGSDVAILLSS